MQLCDGLEIITKRTIKLCDGVEISTKWNNQIMWRIGNYY
jgi:hypothetical protein